MPIDWKFAVDWVSLALTAAGIILAILAYRKAESAIAMARRVLHRKDDQEDIQRLRDLLDILKEAKDVAQSRKKGAPKILSKGIPTAQGDALILRAQDALISQLPLSFDKSEREAASETAKGIEKSLLNINLEMNDEDHWGGIVVALQSILPDLEKSERKLKNDALLR